MKTGQRILMAMVALCTLTFLSTSVQADPLTLTLTNPNQSGAAGNILSFTGSLSNGGAPAVQIFSSQISFDDGGGTLFLDDTPFVVNFLGQSLAAGSTLGPLEMFTIEILAGATPGTYTGVFSVLYDNGTGIPETNLFSFSVTVLGAQAVPEPMALLLLGSGLLGLSGLVRWRKGSAVQPS